MANEYRDPTPIEGDTTLKEDIQNIRHKQYGKAVRETIARIAEKVYNIWTDLSDAITNANSAASETRAATTETKTATTNANNATNEAKTVLGDIKKTDFSKMQEELANLFPGGTQILRNTNTNIPPIIGHSTWTRGEWGVLGSTITDVTVIEVTDCPNPNVRYGRRVNKKATGDGGIRQNVVPLVVGEKYAFSCYARGIDGNTHFRLQYGVTSNWRVEEWILTSNWKRFHITFVATTATTDIILNMQTSATGAFEICGEKLESGNKATDWSQSPWDIENAINSVAISPSTSVPRATGAASAGAEAAYSRGDHVHPAQTSITGNAGSATKLQTARTINGVAFDGTGNIEILPTINTGLSFAGQTGGREVFCRRVGKMVFINGYFTSTGTGTVSLNNLPRTAENVRFTAAGVSGGATRLISCTISNNATSVNFTQITADTAYVFNFSYVAA